MATITETIPSDHSTFQVAENSIGADPTDNYIFELESGAAAMALCTSNFSNANSVTVEYTCQAGDRYYDQSGWATDMASAEGTGGRSVPGSNFCFDIRTYGIIISYLELNNTFTFPIRPKAGADAWVVHHCISHGYGLLYDQGSTGSGTVYYVACYGLSYTNPVWVLGGTVAFGHCSVNAGGASAYHRSHGGVVSYDNCIGNTGSTADYPTATGDYSAGADTSAPGANAYDSVASTTIYAGTTAGSEDLRMPAGVLATYVGPNLTGTFGTLDIENNTVPGSGNVVIGCFQGSGAAATIARSKIGRSLAGGSVLLGGLV